MSFLLPEEMIMEIVQRLPPKSLIRFKCVCKSWRSLFGSSSFMTKILLPDRDDDNLLLVKYFHRTNHHNMLSSISVAKHDLWQPRNLLLPRCPQALDDDLPYYIQILGSHNDLICLRYDNCSGLDIESDIALWSLATGDVKFVPPPPPVATGPALRTTFGFGYDDISQDYKVIRITHGKRWRVNRVVKKVEIYSCKSDSWRGILCYDLLATFLPDRNVPYTNGVVSWMAIHQLEDFYNWVLWFRFSDESFGAFTLPPNRFHGKPYHTNKLLALNDRLGMVIYEHSDDLVEISFHFWVLLEFGVDDSWTPLFTLGPLVGWIEEPLWFWNNGKMIMLNSDQEFVLCDPFGRDIKLLQTDALPDVVLSGTQIISISAKYMYKT